MFGNFWANFNTHNFNISRADLWVESLESLGGVTGVTWSDSTSDSTSLWLLRCQISVGKKCQHIKKILKSCKISIVGMSRYPVCYLTRSEHFPRFFAKKCFFLQICVTPIYLLFKEGSLRLAETCQKKLFFDTSLHMEITSRSEGVRSCALDMF